MKKDEYSFLEIFGGNTLSKHCNRGKDKQENTWHIISGKKPLA